MLAVTPPATQASILDALAAAGGVLAGSKRDAAQLKQRQAAIVAVVIAALAGLGPLAKRRQRGGEPQDALAQKAVDLAYVVLQVR